MPTDLSSRLEPSQEQKKKKQLKARLLSDAKLKKPHTVAAQGNESNLSQRSQASYFNASESASDFKYFPAYKELSLTRDVSEHLQLENPFFKMHQGLASDTTVIEGRSYINFGSYNYLSINEDPRLIAAAKQAIDDYGVSCSASRVVSGERAVQRELESALANLHHSDDAAVFVSGHATNVTTIGYLFTPKDLIIHDALIHNSVIQGIQLSGAARLSFKHNDCDELEEMLRQRRGQFERVLIVTEGLFSMEGDIPDLPKLIEIKQRYNALLMVDEAHSIGVLGETGGGIAEYFSVSSNSVDIWMGTLSKTLASCGGYIAGSQALIDMLKGGAPGYLFSVGIAPTLAAAALTALDIMRQEPERIKKLNSNAALFDRLARLHNIDTGTNQQQAIIPVVTGSSLMAVRLANSLFEQGINAQPILHPAVEERLARLRFFICASHSEQQIMHTIDVLSKSMRSLEII
tara:strand:+ start:1684 stop:3069 length:1386 start_codon:yes stop_codon:yes gene_type:complete